MKKIPTLFERVFENHRIKEILPQVEKGLEWVLDGEGIATVKYDGSCCAIINGKLYKRYDAKKGKPVPQGAIKCQEEPDAITGHLPCWVKCDRNDPADKWFWAAFDYAKEKGMEFKCDLTYEAIGKHFNDNPYNLDIDLLTQHGVKEVIVGRSFEEIKEYLKTNEIEGLVFWKDGKPRCKIKRTDFGYSWPPKKDTGEWKKDFITSEMRREMKRQFEKKQLSHARKQFKRAPYKYTPLEVKEVKNEQD